MSCTHNVAIPWFKFSFFARSAFEVYFLAAAVVNNVLSLWLEKLNCEISGTWLVTFEDIAKCMMSILGFEENKASLDHPVQWC